VSKWSFSAVGRPDKVLAAAREALAPVPGLVVIEPEREIRAAVLSVIETALLNQQNGVPVEISCAGRHLGTVDSSVVTSDVELSIRPIRDFAE